MTFMTLFRFFFLVEGEWVPIPEMIGGVTSGSALKNPSWQAVGQYRLLASLYYPILSILYYYYYYSIPLLLL